jgi:hypothetical protein
VVGAVKRAVQVRAPATASSVCDPGLTRILVNLAPLSMTDALSPSRRSVAFFHSMEWKTTVSMGDSTGLDLICGLSGLVGAAGGPVLFRG